MTDSPKDHSLLWRDWIERLQAIAQSGLAYSENAYDRERYEQLRELTAEIAATYSVAELQEMRGLFSAQAGYATPKVDVRAAVFRNGQLLLVRERSDGLWTLPGGWADVGDTPREAIEREVIEETGFRVKATKVLAILDRNRQKHPPFPFSCYKVFFRCEILDGSPTTSHEIEEVGFFSPSEIPPLSLSPHHPFPGGKSVQASRPAGFANGV